MQIGHESYDLFYSDVTGETKNLLELQNEVFQAFLDVGMVTTDASGQSVRTPSSGAQEAGYDTTRVGPVPNHTVLFYIQPGGFHALQSWQLGFLNHLTAFYRPAFNDTTRRQGVDYSWHVGQTAPLQGNPSDDTTALIASLTVVSSLLVASVAFILFHHPPVTSTCGRPPSDATTVRSPFKENTTSQPLLQ
jgi:hypothetical protein